MKNITLVTETIVCVYIIYYLNKDFLINIMDKFPQHVYMLNMKKSNVENFHYNILLYIYANIYNLGSFKPLFTLKIKGKITLAHNFIHI